MTNLLRKLTGALLLLASLPAAAQTPRDSALAQAEWQTTDLGGGAVARRTQTELFGTQQTLSVAIYPRRGFSTLVVQPEGAARATSRLGEEAGADMAINGSYFHMKSADLRSPRKSALFVMGKTTRLLDFPHSFISA